MARFKAPFPAGDPFHSPIPQSVTHKSWGGGALLMRSVLHERETPRPRTQTPDLFSGLGNVL